MRVSELLREKGGDVVTIDPRAQVGSAVSLLMRHTIGGLPVVGADRRVVGFVAERDLVRALDVNRGGISHLPVDRVMRRPAPACGAEDDLLEVMSRMTRERLRHLVVLDGGEIAGVISVGDLVKHRLQQLETEAGVLRDVVLAQRARD